MAERGKAGVSLFLQAGFRCVAVFPTFPLRWRSRPKGATCGSATFFFQGFFF